MPNNTKRNCALLALLTLGLGAGGCGYKAHYSKLVENFDKALVAAGAASVDFVDEHRNKAREQYLREIAWRGERLEIDRYDELGSKFVNADEIQHFQALFGFLDSYKTLMLKIVQRDSAAEIRAGINSVRDGLKKAQEDIDRFVEDAKGREGSRKQALHIAPPPNESHQARLARIREEGRTDRDEEMIRSTISELRSLVPGYTLCISNTEAASADSKKSLKIEFCQVRDEDVVPCGRTPAPGEVWTAATAEQIKKGSSARGTISDLIDRFTVCKQDGEVDPRWLNRVLKRRKEILEKFEKHVEGQISSRSERRADLLGIQADTRTLTKESIERYIEVARGAAIQSIAKLEPGLAAAEGVIKIAEALLKLDDDYVATRQMNRLARGAAPIIRSIIWQLTITIDLMTFERILMARTRYLEIQDRYESARKIVQRLSNHRRRVEQALGDPMPIRLGPPASAQQVDADLGLVKALDFLVARQRVAVDASLEHLKAMSDAKQFIEKADSQGPSALLINVLKTEEALYRFAVLPNRKKADALSVKERFQLFGDTAEALLQMYKELKAYEPSLD